MTHAKPTQLRKHYAANRKRNRERVLKKFAAMRATKERKRIDRANADPIMPDLSHYPKMPRAKRSGFRVTIECLDDGAKSSFVAQRTPFGLSVSPTVAGKRVACVLREYIPEVAR